MKKIGFLASAMLFSIIFANYICQDYSFAVPQIYIIIEDINTQTNDAEIDYLNTNTPECEGEESCWSYDSESNTLVLQNIGSQNNMKRISSNAVGDLNIELRGQNYFRLTSYSNNLVLDGNGTMNCSLGGDYYTCLDVKNLTVNGGIYNLNIQDYSVAIESDSRLTINDGTININSLGEGIETHGLTINGGELNITAKLVGINVSKRAETGTGYDVDFNGGEVSIETQNIAFQVTTEALNDSPESDPISIRISDQMTVREPDTKLQKAAVFSYKTGGENYYNFEAFFSDGGLYSLDGKTVKGVSKSVHLGSNYGNEIKTKEAIVLDGSTPVENTNDDEPIDPTNNNENGGNNNGDGNNNQDDNGPEKNEEEEGIKIPNTGVVIQENSGTRIVFATAGALMFTVISLAVIIVRKSHKKTD